MYGKIGFLCIIFVNLLLFIQSRAACKAAEERAKEIAQSIGAEYWSVSALSGQLQNGF